MEGDLVKRIFSMLCIAMMVCGIFYVEGNSVASADTIVHLERTAGTRSNVHQKEVTNQQQEKEPSVGTDTVNTNENRNIATNSGSVVAESDENSIAASNSKQQVEKSNITAKVEPNEESIVTSKTRGKGNVAFLNQSNRRKIAVVLAGDNQILAEEKVVDEVDKILAQKFPAKQYELVKDKKVYTKLLEYAEDKNITQLDALKKMDFVIAGSKYGYDYVVVLPMYYSGGNFTTTGWTNIVQQNITLRARIVDVNTNEYLYRMDVIKQGEAGNAFGVPSNVRAAREAVHKCLLEVLSDIDIGQKLENV